MIEWITGILGNWFGFDIAYIIMVCVALNLVLSGVNSALDYIQDKTKTDLDNKLHVYTNKAAALIQKALDMLGYNPSHK